MIRLAYITQTAFSCRVPGGFSSGPMGPVTGLYLDVSAAFCMCFLDQSASRPSKIQGFFGWSIFWYARGVQFFRAYFAHLACKTLAFPRKSTEIIKYIKNIWKIKILCRKCKNYLENSKHFRWRLPFRTSFRFFVVNNVFFESIPGWSHIISRTCLYDLNSTVYLSHIDHISTIDPSLLPLLPQFSTFFFMFFLSFF